MAHPLPTPGVLPSHETLGHEARDGVEMTLHSFEAHSRFRTNAADGIVTMRVLFGRLQVIGCAGHEAWAIGAGELVALGSAGPYEIVALAPSNVWISVHRGGHRKLQLARA